MLGSLGRYVLVAFVGVHARPPSPTQAFPSPPPLENATTLSPSSPLPDATVMITSSSPTRRLSPPCLGVLIAPTTVVASTACLAYAFDWFAMTSSVAMATSLSVQGQSDRTIAVASVATPPTIAQGGSFSLLELKRPMLDTPPALLQTLAPGIDMAAVVSLHTSSLSQAGDDTTVATTPSTLLALSSCAPQLERLHKVQKNQSSHADASDWLCIDTVTPVSTTTTTIRWVADGLLLSQDTHATRRPILWGLVWTLATHVDEDTVGMPSSTLVQAVSALRDFVTAHAVGHQWTVGPTTTTTTKRPKNTTPNASTAVMDKHRSSGSADHDSELPVGDSRPVGDSSHDHDGSVHHTPSAAPLPRPPPRCEEVPLYLYDFAGAAAVLTSTKDPKVTNATLAYVVSPRHLVLPRAWLRASNASTLQYATMLSGKQTRVKQITFETEFYAGGKSELLVAAQAAQLDLVVVELEDPVGDAVARSIVATPPQQHVDYWQPLTKLVDRAVRHTGKNSDDNDGVDETVYMTGATSFVETDTCGRNTSSLTTENDPEFLCAKMTEPSTPYPAPGTPHVPSVMGVMELDSDLVGFTLESPSDPHTFTVLRLASPPHKAFLDAATNGLVSWQQTDGFAADARETATYAAYETNLYSVDQDGDDVFACTGLLVAPQFVLTTASCLQDATAFSYVGLKRKPWEDERLVAVQADHQIMHPLFKTAASDFLVDVAVIGLEEAVLDITPVALNPGYPAWVQNATVDGAVLTRGGTDRSRDTVGVCGVEAFGVAHGNHSGNANGSASRSSFRPRGICMTRPKATVKQEAIPRQHWPGQPLITTTSFGVSTASGFSVHVGENDADSDDVELHPFGIMSTPETETTTQTATQSASGGSVQVFLSFADNANFINGHARGVVWGKQPAMTALPSLAVPPAYVVGLRITKDGPNFCSGTLVASGYVLTAAHCVGDALVNYIEVSGGLSGPEVLPVVRDSVRVHDSYGAPYQYSFDAAILELAMPASAYGVALDLSSDYAAKTRATMFGFGVRSSADLDKPSTVHTVADMPIYTRAQCAATLPDIDGSMLCAGGEKGKDACQGDSGGPLVLRSPAGDKDFLVGIVSAGYGCGLDGVPGVYARASSLVSFVQSYVAGGRFAVASGSTTPTPSIVPTVTPSRTNESRSSVDPTTIESYSGNNTTSHGANPASAPSGTHAASAPAGSEFGSPLVATGIPKDLQAPVRAALMSFLMGDWYSFVEDPVSPLMPLMEPTNELTLRSRGDALTLVTTLRRHEAKPLYARKDRFGRGTSVKALWEGGAATSSKNACTMGSH